MFEKATALILASIVVCSSGYGHRGAESYANGNLWSIGDEESKWKSNGVGAESYSNGNLLNKGWQDNIAGYGLHGAESYANGNLWSSGGSESSGNEQGKWKSNGIGGQSYSNGNLINKDGQGSGYDGHNEHNVHIDYHAHPKYEYSYGVSDSHTHDSHQQQEHRDGDVVHGEYSLHESDGTIRTVKYTSSHKNGLNAHVTRSGHAKHPVTHIRPAFVVYGHKGNGKLGGKGNY